MMGEYEIAGQCVPTSPISGRPLRARLEASRDSSNARFNAATEALRLLDEHHELEKLFDLLSKIN